MIDVEVPTITIKVLIDPVKLRATAESLAADMQADYEAGAVDPPPPIEQMERELVESWSQEMADPPVFVDAITETDVTVAWPP